MKINLRMNLSDFINQPYEAHVIDKLEEIHKDSVTYYLTLWYADGDVSNEDIKRFLVDYESNLHFKTKIKVGDKLSFGEFIWFDLIRNNQNNNSGQIRFQYLYDKKENILNGLDEFHKCAKFCTSEKPPKRQKRNDYESSDNRK